MLARVKLPRHCARLTPNLRLKPLFHSKSQFSKRRAKANLIERWS
jgi:hypothetical protein